MPEEVIIEYHRNLRRGESEALRSKECEVAQALGLCHIFGRSNWIAKVDSKNRNFYVLERVSRPGEMLTYCLMDEVIDLDSKTLCNYLRGGRTWHDEPLVERSLAFEELSPETRMAIANEYIDSTIIVPKKMARIGTLEDLPRSNALPTHVELPPTLSALTDDGFAQILVLSGNDAAGDWLRLHLIVYRHGGHVFFREIDSSNFEAVIKF